jgi:hypothetical protein
MNKIIKFTIALITTTLIFTPLSQSIYKNSNIIKANEVENQKYNFKQGDSDQSNIIKHIKYIDNKIQIQNNELIIQDKNSILKYIEENWKEINKNNQFKSKEEFYNNIESTIKDMNKKVKSGYYNLQNNKGIVNTYELLGNRGGYETYNYWWGAQFYAKSSYGAENLARDCEDNAYVSGGSSIVIGYFVAPVGALVALAALNFGYMATKVRRCFNDYGSVKLTLYAYGAYFITEPIQ